MLAILSGTALLVGYLMFDVHYFLRMITVVSYCLIRTKLKGKQDLMDEDSYRAVCLTTDMDFQWHMNNARYLRECDYARFSFWISNSGLRTKNLMLVKTSTIRYRRSLQLFDVYAIKTKILGWDEKAIYLQHSFERQKDGFICALVFVNVALVGITPQALLEDISGKKLESPEILPEVKKWIECNQMSSERLRVKAA